MNPDTQTYHSSRSAGYLYEDIPAGPEAVVESYQYDWVPARIVPDALLLECSKLYSEHYGTWGAGTALEGQPVRLSVARLREWTTRGDASVAVARLHGVLVGYAIVLRARCKDFGTVSWVTQFVVHRGHRRRGVGQKLLFAAWGISDHAAWGITTSNPYAVRALEKATRRRCMPGRILRNRRRLEGVGIREVPYLAVETKFEISATASRVDTSFFVDHSGLSEKLANVTTAGKPWLLGDLPPGWEWFAFCFADQEPVRLTHAEIEGMLEAADEVAREAYGRMSVVNHPWARHTGREVEFLRDACGVREAMAVLDIGCGVGRHAVALATLGHDVVGVDYSSSLIDRARKEASRADLSSVRFLLHDCRRLDLGKTFDAVICLYDVIGSYASDESNRLLLDAIFRHLRPGGHTLLSVMNLTLTRQRATQFFSVEDAPDKLLGLVASQTMQTSGDIFDPNHFMFETTTGVVYRKERFDADGQLPVELIVRDRRFSVEEIGEMARSAGLVVRWARPVRAGRWDEELEETDPHAKEILVLCERPPA